ncbi:Protein GLUTAMINE DUMPER 2 [Glycine soja]
MNDTIGNSGEGRLRWSGSSSDSFLYGGLVPIFVVIGVALLVLACSRGHRRSQTTTESVRNVDVNRSRELTNITQVDERPNILVILAGEEHPTHLAKPLSV